MFPPLTEAGPVSADQMWERIDYFLKRVVPVATEEKVKMALHPHDPPVPVRQPLRRYGRQARQYDSHQCGSDERLDERKSRRAGPYSRVAAFHSVALFCNRIVSTRITAPDGL